MDYRFPKWLRTIVNRLSFLAIPNLGGLLAGIAVVAFLANMLAPLGAEYLVFDANLILEHGEWWRLFTFPFMAGFRNPLNLLFYVMYVYFVMQILESHWGAGPLTVFTIFSYLCSLAGGLIFRAHVDLSIYIMENISLVLGTLLPNLELSIYFVLPIKAKWLALFAGALLLIQFITAPSLAHQGFMLFAFFPYLLFFTPLGVQTIRGNLKRKNNRRKFDNDMWR